jgi:hypothetical protein
MKFGPVQDQPRAEDRVQAILRRMLAWSN